MPSVIQKLLRQLNASIHSIQTPPALSLGRQNSQYHFTIAGVVASFILGVVSFVLALNARNASMKIEKMDSLINLLSLNLTKQDTQIRKLNGLANNQQITNRELIDQIGATKDQTSYLQNNSQPDIGFGSIGFTKSNLDTAVVIYIAQLTNNGGRKLTDLHTNFYFFPKTKVVKDSIYFLINIKPNFYSNNSSYLNPNGSQFQYVNLPENHVIDSVISISCVMIIVDWIDPFNKKKVEKPYYFKNILGLNGQTAVTFPSQVEGRIMNGFYQTLKKQHK